MEVERNVYGRKKHINYKFIPTSLFRGRPLIRGLSGGLSGDYQGIIIKSPDEWATTKQACRDELVVYVFFSSVYIYIYIYIIYILFYFIYLLIFY